MKFLTHSEICSSEWINLLNKSSFSSPFQTPTYYNILKITADINAEVFALEIAGNLKALMVITIMKEPGIRSLFSRRGIIFGGPVLGDITNEESFFFL